MYEENFGAATLGRYVNAPIRVTVAASAAFNTDTLKSNIAGLMEKLGCGTCFSGFDCRFSLQRDYVLSEKGVAAVENINAPAAPVLNVGVSSKDAFNLDSIVRLVDELHGKFGCMPCHSGYDFRFRNEMLVFGQ